MPIKVESLEEKQKSFYFSECFSMCYFFSVSFRASIRNPKNVA